MRQLSRLFLLLLFCHAGALFASDLVVVVSAKSGLERLTRAELVNIYMGRYRVLPGGRVAHPIDLPDAHPARAQFYRKLVGKELSEINAYWARLVFSGKTTPPRQARTAAEAVEWIASREGAVAYLERNRLDERLKVVLELP